MTFEKWAYVEENGVLVIVDIFRVGDELTLSCSVGLRFHLNIQYIES